MHRVTNPVAYYMEDVKDVKEAYKPLRISEKNLTEDEMNSIGVQHYRVDMKGEWTKNIDSFSAMVGMRTRDSIVVSRRTMPDFDKKILNYFSEHLHPDPELRFILDGSGHFDVRDRQDRWIRIPVKKGDLLFLPAGIFHRFAFDHDEYVEVLRFYKEISCWEAHYRNTPTTESMPCRMNYVASSTTVQPV